MDLTIKPHAAVPSLLRQRPLGRSRFSEVDAVLPDPSAANRPVGSR